MTVAMIQVFPIMRIEDLKGFLYVIIAMGLFFFHLELKQFLTDYRGYLTYVSGFGSEQVDVYESDS